MIAVPRAAISQADADNAIDLTEIATKKTAAETLKAANEKGFARCGEIVGEAGEALLEEFLGEGVAGEFLGELIADVWA